MSAPQTNLEKQSHWHRGPIIGMAAAVIFALGLLFWQMVMVADGGTPMDSGADQIDGRTGGQTPDATPPDVIPPVGDPPTIPPGDLPPPDLPPPDLPPPDLPEPAPDLPPVPATP